MGLFAYPVSCNWSRCSDHGAGSARRPTAQFSAGYALLHASTAPGPGTGQSNQAGAAWGACVWTALFARVVASASGRAAAGTSRGAAARWRGVHALLAWDCGVPLAVWVAADDNVFLESSDRGSRRARRGACCCAQMQMCRCGMGLRNGIAFRVRRGGASALHERESPGCVCIPVRADCSCEGSTAGSAACMLLHDASPCLGVARWWCERAAFM